MKSQAEKRQVCNTHYSLKCKKDGKHADRNMNSKKWYLEKRKRKNDINVDN